MVSQILITAIIGGILITGVVVYLLRPSVVRITDKALDLSAVMPIQTITDDCIVNGNGDITVGYRMFLPEVFMMSEEDVRFVHDKLEGLLKMLPAGTVIHQQNFYYTEEYSVDTFTTNPLINENKAYYEGKGILNAYTNIYISFTQLTSNSTKKFRRSGADTSLMRRYNYPFKQPYKDYGEGIKNMEKILMNFENGLHSITQFDIKRMNSKELNNAIYDYLNLSYDQPTADATQETVNPMTVTEQGNFKIGNQFLGILSLSSEGEQLHESNKPTTGKANAFGSGIELPDNIKSKCSMLYPLGLGLPFNHIVNVIIEITDPDTTVSSIANEKQKLNYIAKFYRPAYEKQENQKTYIDEISKFDYSTSVTSFNVIISDTDTDRLNQKIALVEQGYSFMNQSSCYIENAEVANIFFTGIPGNARANYRGFVNTTKQAICYLQKDSVYISSLEGHTYLDRFGKPIMIDIWNYPKLSNKNKIVIGPSGTGKSFWLNSYILQSYEMGRDIMLIDIGGSYKSMINLNHGKYFDSAIEEEFAFNPFLCDTDKNGNYMYIDTSDRESQNDLIDTLFTILSWIWKEADAMTKGEKSALNKSIINFYKYINASNSSETKERIFPNLINYRNYVRDNFLETQSNYIKDNFNLEEFLDSLEPYCEGQLSFLLNAKENIDIVNDDLICFDMEAAKSKTYFPLISIITLQMALNKIKRRQGIQKELIIDEALDFLQDEKFGSFIAYLYRTIRKKNGSVTIAAQNVAFLKPLPPTIKDSILINSDIKVILDHSAYRSSLPDIQNILSINDEEIAKIESIQVTEKWREFFIKLGNYSFVFRNEVSPFAAVAFDSRQQTVVRLKELFRETGSTVTAIRLYLEEQNKKLL